MANCVIIYFAPKPPILAALIDSCSPKFGGWGADYQDVLICTYF
jgi:hypothetical protein